MADLLKLLTRTTAAADQWVNISISKDYEKTIEKRRGVPDVVKFTVNRT